MVLEHHTEEELYGQEAVGGGQPQNPDHLGTKIICESVSESSFYLLYLRVPPNPSIIAVYAIVIYENIFF
jgi:hypothetical protein